MDCFFDVIDENGTITIKPELLSIDVYNTLWERYKSKSKQLARKELTFIWAMCCRDTKRNIYAGYIDKNERASVVVDDLFGKTKWIADDLVKQGIIKYLERNPKTIYEEEQEATYKNIKSLSSFIDYMSEHLKDLDDNGKPVYDAKKLQEMLKQRGETLLRYKEISRLVEEEKEHERIKGGREEGLFDNPDNIDWL